jgi:phosphohistidine swiveling domain-containing protein
MKAVVDLIDARDVAEFGGKAVNLGIMLRSKLPVPDGFCVGISAFGPDGTLSRVRFTQVQNKLERDVLYAVRSSARTEDMADASWAGQFESFLNVPTNEVVAKVEECHSSAKARAKAYADKQGVENFEIAVVVQEMIQSDYAGVMFTKDPVKGDNKVLVEYVKGLAEDLVSGLVTPEGFEWDRGTKAKATENHAPFDGNKLIDIGLGVEALYDVPQDIEWVVKNNEFFLVQTRPITTLTTGHVVKKDEYSLGKPEELFYWGPSRGNAMYVSDFMEAAEQFFTNLAENPGLPDPPRTLVLIHGNKWVWLNNAKEFSSFTRKSFEVYEKLGRIDADRQKWHKKIEELKNADALQLVEAWKHTLFAEFSLYGAETALSRKLARFEPKVSQKIWGAFTSPDNSTFLARIDRELLETRAPKLLAEKYPWIEDGYSGTYQMAAKYFTDRLKILLDNDDTGVETKKDRPKLAKELGLTKDEVASLDLARKLAEFMDDRKAWMMQTRQNIKTPAGNIEHGWFFDGNKVRVLGQSTADELWQRYIGFKASASVVKGIVASNGGRHFVNGKVAIATSPADIIPKDSILVVPSTSPSYVPLMREARALVTDHGGMMSHAAIVAREFNLPCIVGTKSATKSLKNGDKVVLNLLKGEVSK